MWDDLMRALCLMLVVEGLLPAIAPDHWREMVSGLGQANPHAIRQIGIASMVLGAAALYFLSH